MSVFGVRGYHCKPLGPCCYGRGGMFSLRLVIAIASDNTYQAAAAQ